MKYLMLLHSNPAAFAELSPDEQQAAFAFFEDLQRETMEAGEYVDAAGLADVSHARTVRREGDAAVVTDGPFAESKEVLVSYALYDVESHDRAMELAAKVATATSSAVEVWPIMDFSGTDM
jgi:hypothetical protein